MPRVTLIGYRGVGKTSVAAGLAARLGCGWCDCDVELERRLGRSIADVITQDGEPAFRDAEQTLLAELLRDGDAVLATGGGVILREANRERLMASGTPVVWLQADAATIRRRLAADPSTAHRRPGLTTANPLDEVADVLAVREPLYATVADVTVDTASQSIDVVVERIAEWLATAEDA
jgi:shikimate kinase